MHFYLSIQSWNDDITRQFQKIFDNSGEQKKIVLLL